MREVAHPLFLKLASSLRDGLVSAEKLETRATGKAGMILPAEMPAPARTTDRPVSVLLPRGAPKLLLPKTYMNRAGAQGNA